jgi:hypothetical protein
MILYNNVFDFQAHYTILPNYGHSNQAHPLNSSPLFLVAKVGASIPISMEYLKASEDEIPLGLYRSI